MVREQWWRMPSIAELGNFLLPDALQQDVCEQSLTFLCEGDGAICPLRRYLITPVLQPPALVQFNYRQAIYYQDNYFN